MSDSSIEADWKYAKAWLLRELDTGVLAVNRSRWAGMTPENFARMQSAHSAALRLPVSEREAFLGDFFPGEPVLQREVLELLHFSDAAG